MSQRGHVDETDIVIQPKLIDINTETYWELVDRLYAQCERAMDNGHIEEDRTASFEEFFPKLIQLQVPIHDGTALEDLIKLFYVTQISLEIMMDKEKSAEEEIVDLEKNFKKVQKDLENEIRNHQTTKTLHEQNSMTTTNLEKSLKESKDTIKRLQSEIQELTTQNKDLDTRLKNDMDQNLKSKKGIERAQEERQNLLYEIKSLDEKLRNTVKLNEKKSKEAEELTTKIAEYERDLQESKILTREMSKTTKKLEEEIAILTGTIMELEKEKQSITTTAQKSLKQLEEQNENKYSELTDLQQIVSHLEVELNQERENSEKLQTIISETTSRISDMEDKIYQKEQLIFNLENEVDQLRQENHNLTQSNIVVGDNESSENHQQITKITIEQEKLTNLQNQIEKLTQSLENTLAESISKSKTIEQITKSISDRENELAMVKAKLHEYEKGVNGLDEALKEIRYLREQILLRDKDIEEYKVKLTLYYTGLQEFEDENKYLRNKLGIPMKEDLKKYLTRKLTDAFTQATPQQVTTTGRMIQTDDVVPPVKEVIKEVVKYIDRQVPISVQIDKADRIIQCNIEIPSRPTSSKSIPKITREECEAQTDVTLKKHSQSQTMTVADNSQEVIDDLNQKIKVLEAQLSFKPHTQDNACQTIKLPKPPKINHEALELRNQMKERDEQYKIIISKLKENIETIQLSNQALLDEATRVQTYYQNENLILKNTVDVIKKESEKRMVIMNEEIQKANEEISRLQSILKSEINEKNVIDKDKKVRDTELTELQNMLNEREGQINKAFHMIEGFKSTIKLLERDLEEKIEHSEELKRVNLKLEKRCKYTEAKLKEATDKLDTIADNSRLLLEKEAVIENLKLDQQQLIHEHEVDLESINRFSENMKHTIENLNEILEQKEATIHEYENKINQIREEHMRDKYEAQQEILRLQKRINNDNNNVLTNLKMNIDKIENQGEPETPHEAGVRIEEVEEMISAKTSEMKTLNDKISKLESQLREKDEILHEAMKSFDTMKTKFDKEVEEYKQTIQDIQVELFRSKEEGQKLKRQLSEHALKKQIAIQQQKFEKLAKQKEQLENTVQKLTSNLLKAEEKIAAIELHKTNVDKYEIEQLRKKEEKLKEKIEDQMRNSVNLDTHKMLISENQRLKSKIEELSKKDDVIFKDKQESLKKIEELTAELNEVKKIRQEKSNKIVDLQKEIQDHVRAKKKLRSDIEKLQKENEELQKAKQMHIEEKKGHSQQITKALKKYNDLQEERDKIKQEVTNLKKELAEMENQKDIEKRHAVEKTRVEYQKQIHANNEEINEIKKEKEKLLSEIESLKIENSELKNFTFSKRDSLQAQKESSKKEPGLNSKLEKLQQENSILQHQLDDLRKENDDLKQTKLIVDSATKSTNQTRNDQLKRLTKELEQANEERDALKKEVEEAKLELEELKSSAKLKSQQYFEKKQQDLSLNLTKAIREKEEVIKEKNRLLQEVKELRKENEELKGELSAFDPEFFEEIEDLKYNYVQSLEQIKQLKKRLQDLDE
ncbi:hypothetical protein C9374_009529 [Naegleria lovaniensis]|uniref:Uncharacterized protein n=1 Tax=Naegleria lovaniensis TaxID=51637 RepID=A0AA88H4Y6_NAELO|nr:uncharacterized protein C9374_009529 [Naegleria lovaniensis]KAG2392952.1 hypothetical protein C9374_009529 [Naegleria lovaniensis]